MLHSAVLEKNGLALILPATPGSGKSTLCATLLQHGWRLLSDEFGLVRPEDGMLIPFPRPIPLKNNSIDILREKVGKHRIGPTFYNTRKGDLAHLQPPKESIEKAHIPAQPAWIVTPKYRPNTDLRFSPITKTGAFIRLTSNSFNYEKTGRRGFDTVNRLVQSCDCYHLEYSTLDDAVACIETLAKPPG